MLFTIAILTYVREALVVFGFLTAYGGVVAVWVRNNMTIAELQKQVKELTDMHTSCKAEQQARHDVARESREMINRALTDSLSALRETLGRVDQKLDDFIKWSKNGKNK